MKTAINVCFSSTYTKGLDKLYTYLINPKDDIMEKDIIWVETPDGFKKALVVKIDRNFSPLFEKALVKKYGPLKYGYSKKPTLTISGVKKL